MVKGVKRDKRNSSYNLYLSIFFLVFSEDVLSSYKAGEKRFSTGTWQPRSCQRDFREHNHIKSLLI
jgi:hypothetical protein